MSDFAGVGIIGTMIGKMLEFFGQKVSVYIEISFNHDKPYRLIIKNRSGYDVLIDQLIVTPDGFPSKNNGWMLNDSKLFQNKKLQPGQKINVYFTHQDIGEIEKREFKVQYHTLIAGISVPRKEESCIHLFEKMENTVRLTISR